MKTLTRKPVDLMPEVPLVGEASRAWGIEIEVAGARGVNLPKGWFEMGDGSLVSPYREAGVCDCDCHACDKGHHDCNDQLCFGDPNEDDCNEFISPILRDVYEHGISEICSEARFEPQNDSAGIHIHVDAYGVTPRQIAAVMFAYALLDPILEESYERVSRAYCQKISGKDVQRVEHAANQATQKEVWKLAVLERDLAVNLHSLAKHGTIEFRAMGPVYDAKTLHKWAMLCREIVNAAMEAPIESWVGIKDVPALLDQFRKYGKEINMIESRG